ncbi:MAG: ornithine cyclodeaminase family protein [Gemmatimonadetes bacterium]|nr:ornithine cyclodeaminase family protein [Gemmatimonadota bacterium]
MRTVEEEVLRARVREPAARMAAERAFRALASDAVVVPPPVHLPIAESAGEVHIKSAYLAGSRSFTVKIASGFYRNPELGLPSGSGLLLVFDARTGFPLALLRDNGYLTDLRTGAAGALAARLLAPPVLERVAVLGSGAQAGFQLRALAGVRSWAETVIWSRNPEHAAARSRELEQELGVRTSPAATVAEAVAGAELVITVTPSREPLLQATWLRSDATVIAVGADGPGKRELAVDVLLRADKVIADSCAQCRRLGELQHVPDGVQVHGELGEVLTGRVAGREGDELIVCDLTGVGAQDAAIAEAALVAVAAAVGSSGDSTPPQVA